MRNSIFVLVAVGTSLGLVKVYNATNNFALVSSFQAATGSNFIYRIKQLPNGNVATVANEPIVKIWNPSNNWALVLQYTSHTGIVYAIEVIDDNFVATGGADGVIRVWNFITGFDLEIINVGTPLIYDLKLQGNLCNLECALSNGSVNVYNLNSGIFSYTQVVNFPVLSPSFMSLEISKKQITYAGAGDGTIRTWMNGLWRVQISYTNTFIGHTNYVEGLKFLSVDTLASSSLDRTIRLWNTTTGQLMYTLISDGQMNWNTIDLLCPGVMVSTSQAGTIKLWNITAGSLISTPVNSGLTFGTVAVL